MVDPTQLNAPHTSDRFAPSILIADDHPAVRAGLRSLISSRAGWYVVGEAGDGAEAVSLALELKPSAVVMDISMPLMDGLEATRRIREQLPAVEVLIVSQHDSERVVAEAQKAGARGFVVKSHLSADLLPALEAALLHSSRISSPVVKAWQDAISTGNATGEATLADPGPHDDLDLMSGGGEMGALMRAQDWSKTSFGPLSQWPQSLRTALRICLDSRFPILIWWGPELRMLYNDAYRPALGTKKHPQALGAPGRKVWGEIWDTIGPMLEGVMRNGQATWENDQLLLFDRLGYLEETYWTYSYSAIRLPSGEVGGVFSAIHGVTEKVLTARRLKTLREVADQVVQAKNEVDACHLAMQSIVRNPADCPFAMIFLCDSRQARLVAASFEDRSRVPATLDLSGEDSWGIARAVRTRTAQVLSVADPESMPAAPYGDKCAKAISLPILGSNRVPIAVMTIAISPYRALDDSYQEFFESLARNLAANINNARAYDEERKRAEALAELDRAKTAFFSNVSHEFRTPLTLMLAPLEDLLAARDGLSAEQRERLEVAHRNSVRLLRLVNNLLDFSRIEAGRIQASYEPTELCTLTEELAGVFRSAVERAGLRLVVNCSSASEPVYVDREMWEKIVFNLLSNAFKFTFEGEIEVSLQPVKDRVELSVRDTGTGIPEQELPHLFERFYRVKGAHGRTFEGSGIGLSLVRELARLHGGTVGVKSTLGQGSTFTVSVPMGKEHLPADRIGAARTLESTGLRGEAYVQEALRWLPGDESFADDIEVGTLISPDHPPLGAAGASETRPRILIADDNADMRQYLQRLLSQRYDVEVAADGEAALSSARARRPEVILSDIMMPRLDGLGLLQAVRTDETLSAIPVLLLSARAGEESRIEGIQSGADDYLVKPFSARELLARVQSHLVMARTRQQAGEVKRKLHLEAEWLAAIVASSDDAIVSKNLDGIITSWNRSAERIFGYTASEAIGRHITLIIPPERLSEETEILNRLRRGQRVDHFETVRRRKDGTEVDVSLTISPVRDASGQVVGASKVARDITAQKIAERALRESTARATAATAKFRAVFEQTTQFAGIMSTDGVLTEANRLSVDACGYRAEEVLHKPFTETAWWRNSHESREKIRAAIPLAAQGIPYRETLYYSWADGTERLLDFALYPIVDETGKVLFLHPTGVDVTEVKRAQEAYRKLAESLDAQVQARTKELEERNAEVLSQSEQLRALSWQLLRTQDEERRHIARELHDSAGQTLTVLGMNLAQLVQKAGRNAPELAQYAEQIQETVQQLHREIRTTSYLLHPPLLDETGLSSALDWYVQGLTDRSGLDIALNISEDFGRLPVDMELVIFRLVQECLTNIHRHSGSKSAAIEIVREPRTVTILVEDYGKGMSPERLAEVQSRGSGVGIRGIRERLRQFDGKLNIESGKSGTRITATIPLAESASREEAGRDPLQAAV